MLPMRRCAIALDPSLISKSGKHTPGLAYFWSGTAGAVKRGLEILGFAVEDADSNDAIFMCAKQTRADKVDKGRRPDCLKWCKGNSSLIEQYLRAIHSNETEFLKTSDLFVADAFFSVYPFVEGLATMGFNIVSRLRDKACLRYLYQGEKTGKRGRPILYDGKIDLDNLDDNVFSKETVEIDRNTHVTLQSAVVNSRSLKRNIKLVVATFHEEGKRTQGFMD